MTFSFRGRIVVTALAASATALGCVLLLVGPGLRRWTLEQTRATVLAEARLAAQVAAEPLAAGTQAGQLDPMVDRLARDTEVRLTVIALDGTVLADSAASGPGLLALQSHRDRPEVQQALSGGEGVSVRRSATVAEELIYAAVAVRHEGRLVGVARVARPLRAIEEQAAALGRALGVSLLLGFLVTAALAVLLSGPVAGPIREVMDAARRFAAGDLSARSRVRRQDELGELARILDQSADDLQRRLTEIGRSHARTGAILAAMQDGLLAVDDRGRVVLASQGLCRDLGLVDPVGRHYLEGLRQLEASEAIEAVLRTGESRTLEVELAGLRRSFALSAAPFPAAEGRPHGAVVTFHDVTSLRRLDRVRRDFVANASHELRTPLTSIRGFVEALEDGALEDPALAGRFLGKIRTHADRMATLVADLLELSRLEAGEKAPERVRLSPSSLTADVAAAFAGIAERKGIALVTRDEGAPEVATDPERLRRVVENLLDNALKYTPDGGHVEVVTGPSGDGARVEVRDDGPGIASEHLDRIFERFYRVDKARSRELGGTGLGLSIVRHLAESLGATVSVESELGRGSCFTVRLPPEPPGQRPPGPPPAAAPPA